MAASGYEKRWEKIRLLGKGGQGEVYLVRDRNIFDSARLKESLAKAWPFLGSPGRPESEEAFNKLSEIVLSIGQSQSDDVMGALKVYHPPEDAQEASVLRARMKREIDILNQMHDPHVLSILDFDPDFNWFVTRYYSGGTLHAGKGRFKGNIITTLRAIRPLVECVSRIHESNVVHRDIKPKNIYMDADGSLVLGDFGIAFYTDPDRTRLSDTFMGSPSWAAPWVNFVRVDEVPPSADVFSLGKVIWSMVTGQDTLQLWYFAEPRYNVESLFPDQTFASSLNRLFAKCIVEKEESCLKTAKELLQEIDQILMASISPGPRLLDQATVACIVCSKGRYVLLSDRDPERTREFGLEPRKGTHRIYVCDSCGHAEMFYFPDITYPSWWVRAANQLKGKTAQSFKVRPKMRHYDKDRQRYPGNDDDYLWQLEQNLQLRNVTTQHVLTLTPENYLGFREPNTILLSEQLLLVGARIMTLHEAGTTLPGGQRPDYRE